MTACDCPTGGAAERPSSRLPLMKALIDTLGVENSRHGLSNVVHGFHQAGLGWAVSSWVRIGRNQPISAAELSRGLGDEHVQQLAALSGMSANVAAHILAELLPQVIDHLTPEGLMPEAVELARSVAIVKRALGV